MSTKKISKDVLSFVSRQFFKDVKAKYRLISNLSQIILFALKFFEGQSTLMLSSLHAFSPPDFTSYTSLVAQAASDTDL